MRAVYALIGLVRRYGPGPVDDACATALEIDVVSVPKIGSMLARGTAAAMLDRLLHRSVVLKLDGDSYRLRDHHARTQNQRTATTPTRRSLQ